MLVAEDENKITTPVLQDTFDLLPRFQKKLSLGDKVAWAFSILFGRYLGKQVPLACNVNAALKIASDVLDIPDLTSLLVNAAKDDTRELLGTAPAGYQYWIYGGLLTGSAIGTVTFKSPVPTVISGEFHVGANGQLPFPISRHANQPWFKGGTAAAFEVTLSADIDLDGVLLYRTVKV